MPKRLGSLLDLGPKIGRATGACNEEGTKYRRTLTEGIEFGPAVGMTEMHTVSPRRLRFDRFILDLQRCALLCGQEDIRLRPRSFDVLRYLAEHSGRLVPKEELIQAI